MTWLKVFFDCMHRIYHLIVSSYQKFYRTWPCLAPLNCLSICPTLTRRLTLVRVFENQSKRVGCWSNGLVYSISTVCDLVFRGFLLLLCFVIFNQVIFTPITCLYGANSFTLTVAYFATECTIEQRDKS